MQGGDAGVPASTPCLRARLPHERLGRNGNYVAISVGGSTVARRAFRRCWYQRVLVHGRITLPKSSTAADGSTCRARRCLCTQASPGRMRTAQTTLLGWPRTLPAASQCPRARHCLEKPYPSDMVVLDVDLGCLHDYPWAPHDRRLEI